MVKKTEERICDRCGKRIYFGTCVGKGDQKLFLKRRIRLTNVNEYYDTEEFEYDLCKDCWSELKNFMKMK